MYFELARGARYKRFSCQPDIFAYLRKRPVSLKPRKLEFPDLEIVIDSAALAAFSAPEDILMLKDRIDELGIFSQISLRFSCIRNTQAQPFHITEIETLQNLLTILPKKMRCQNVGIILGGNQIHTVGIYCLFAVLQEVRNIDEIDISNSDLPLFDPVLAAEIFTKFAKIKFLNFSNCQNFNREYLQQVADKCLDLKSLNISRCHLSGSASLEILLKDMALESLNISCTHLVLANQEEFVRLLKENKTLTSLNIARCGIGEVVMLGVLEAVMEKDSHLRAINFSENRLTPSVATSIREVLSQGYLEELKLASCQINDAMMSDILTGVAQSEFLQALDLSGSDFSNHKFKEQLFWAISTAKNLTSLSLSACQISENDLPRLLTMHLENLNLAFGDFRFGDESLQILKRNLELQSLNLDLSLNQNANKVEIYEAATVCNLVRRNLGVNNFLNVSGIDIAVEISAQRMEELRAEAAATAQEIRDERKVRTGNLITPLEGGKVSTKEGAISLERN